MPDLSQFTEKEKLVVDLLLQGMSNDQIAFKLDLSHRTVEFHLTNIYKKLDVSSRVEAVVELLRLFNQ